MPFFLLLPRDHALVRPDGRTDGRSEGGRPNGGPCSRAACALFPPPVCRPSASASSVRSFLVGVPFVVVVDPLRERASVRQFQSCFLPFHSPLSEERKRQRGKKDKGPSKSRRRPVSIQASLLLLLLSSFLSKVCRFSPSTHISLPRGARDKVRLTKKRPTHCLDTMHHLFRKDYK